MWTVEQLNSYIKKERSNTGTTRLQQLVPSGPKHLSGRVAGIKYKMNKYFPNETLSTSDM